MKARRYRNEYEVKEADDGSKKKKIVYIGEHYSFTGNSIEFMTMKKKYLLHVLVIVLLYIAAGLLDYSGDRTMYVVIPYAIVIFPTAYLLVGTGKLFFVKDKMQHIDYDETVIRIKKCTMASMILSLMSAVGEIVFMFITDIEYNIITECIYIFLITMIAVTDYFFLGLQKKYSFEK